MATIMSTGQITLVDLTDQRTSSFYLQADKSKIQVANVNAAKTTYTPNYADATLTISPAFFFGNEKITLNNEQIAYFINETEVTTKIASGASDPTSNKYFIRNGNLYIKQNIPDFGASITQLRIRAVVGAGKVTDDETGLPLANDIEATIEFALVESGRAGTSISKIETYYKTTTNYSTPNINDSDWDQNASKFTLSATNKYLWAYQKTYYKDNTGKETSENGNVFLAGTYGDTGAPGAAGTSVDSITEEYYISTSNTSAVGGSWSGSPPNSLNADKYLWTRTKVVYKDAAGTTTTAYQPNEKGKCDFTWNLAVEEVTKTNAALTTLQGHYDDLQKQVDGAIDTWYGEVAPSITSYPVTEWLDDATKINHNGDLYYNTKTGMAYRYTVVASNGKITSQSWTPITDAALTEALKEIEDLGAAIDGKMTIYYNEATNYPASAAEGDLWIQGTKGDQYKCIKAYNTSVSINSTNWTTYWGLANQTIGRVDIEFTYIDDPENPTTPPASNASWDTIAPEWAQGRYIWQRTVTYDRSGNEITKSAAVCITSATRSIESITNYYLATNLSTGVTIEGHNWKTNASEAVLSKDSPYLWNYERVEYTYGNPDESKPTIIGNFSKDGEDGNPGRGIVNIIEYYLINNSSNKPSFSINSSTGVPTTTDWKTTLQVATDDKPYLWNVEVVEYTSGTKYEAKDPALIGYRGVGIKEAISYYQRNNSSTTAPTINANNSGWSTTFTDVDINNRFLWSFTQTEFTSGEKKKSTPAIISRYTEDGKDAVFALVESTSKTIFTDQDESNITLQARLMVGGTQQTNGVTYKWTKMGSFTSLGSEPTLSIKRDQVTNIATFICTITHTTYAPSGISDRITIQDKKDPVWCEVISSAGNQFTNGNISTKLTATLYGAVKGKYSKADMDKYYFNWSKFNKDGVKDTSFKPTFDTATTVAGQAGYKNTIVIGSNDVTNKAIFTVEVTESAPTST